MQFEDKSALNPSISGAAAKPPRGVVVDMSEGADPRFERARIRLRRQLGEDVYGSWFARVELVSVDAGIAVLSVSTLFLKNWISSHYADLLKECLTAEISGVERIDLVVRQPGRAVRQSEPETRRPRFACHYRSRH